jgi:hypothetical protein
VDADRSFCAFTRLLGVEKGCHINGSGVTNCGVYGAVPNRALLPSLVLCLSSAGPSGPARCITSSITSSIISVSCNCRVPQSCSLYVNPRRRLVFLGLPAPRHPIRPPSPTFTILHRHPSDLATKESQNLGLRTIVCLICSFPIPCLPRPWEPPRWFRGGRSCISLIEHGKATRCCAPSPEIIVDTWYEIDQVRESLSAWRVAD